MTREFELRLIGVDAPEGQLDATDLLAIVTSLRELTIRLGRPVTGAADLGRPSHHLDSVSRLRVGLAPGSTRIVFERRTNEDAFEFDLVHEQEVDEALAQIIEGVATDERKSWVSDTVAESAADLAGALQHAAPEVEFSVDHQIRHRFKTAETHRKTWRPNAKREEALAVTFVGRLEKVDIGRHNFRIRDDVGHEYTIPRVKNDESVMHLIGTHVEVTGVPDLDSQGHLTALREADIGPAKDPVAGGGVPSPVGLDAILASAPGPKPGGISELTDDEIDAFYDALQG